jgi:hypothetical protein
MLSKNNASEKFTMSKTEHEKEARKNLIARCKRIIKFVEMDAPEVIICHGMQRISEMLPFFEKGYRYILEMEVDEKISTEKNKIGICLEKDCVNEVPTLNKSEIGNQRCYVCQKKHKAKETEINDQKK